MAECTPHFLIIPREIRETILEYVVQPHPDILPVEYEELDESASSRLDKDTPEPLGIRSSLKFRRRGSREPELEAKNCLHRSLCNATQSTVIKGMSAVNVLLTCRQLYQETLQLLFAHTKFTFRGEFAFVSLLALIDHFGVDNARLIQSIRLTICPYVEKIRPGESVYVALNGNTLPSEHLVSLALQHLTGLKHLELNLEFHGMHYFWRAAERSPNQAEMIVCQHYLTVNGEALKDCFRPLLARVKSLDSCRLVAEVDTEEFRRKGITSLDLVQAIEDWSERLKGDLIETSNEKQGEVHQNLSQVVGRWTDRATREWRDQCREMLSLDSGDILYLE